MIGARIQLYEVGTTGYGSAATPLFSTPLTTDANGGFSFPAYHCSPSAALVYVTATGGNPGLAAGSNNPQIALMTALGPCSNLTPATFISINELTTVAALSQLAPFASTLTAIGSGSGDAAALAGAFTLADELVDPAVGVAPGTVPAGYSAPVALLNTLADVLAACVNSAGGVAGDSSPCGQLFTLTTTSPTAVPTDTSAAMIALGNFPTLNTATLYALTPTGSPFQPTLAVPPATFAVALLQNSAQTTLAVTPTSLTLPDITAGYPQTPATITVQNTGGATATIAGMVIYGTDAGDFSQANNCLTLAPGATCTVQITATPGALGSRTAALAITANAGNSPLAVPLGITGDAPSAPAPTLSATSLYYNYEGLLQDVTVSNASQVALHFKSITVTNTSNESPIMDPGGFSLYDTTCGLTLPPQSVCTVTVLAGGAIADIDGLAPGFYGVLTIVDDAVSGTQTVSLEQGANEQITAEFPYTFAVMNNDNHVTSIFSGSIYGTNASDWSPNPAGCEGAGPYYNICSFSLTFTPGGNGPRVARLGSPTGYLLLQGNGPAIPGIPGPAFGLGGGGITAYLDYTSVAWGSWSVTINNTGTTSLTPSVQFYSPTPGLFRVSSSCATVAVSASCPINLSFKAKLAGPAAFTGVLVVTDTTSGLSQQLAVPVQVVYIPPVITPPYYAFPSQAAGTTSAPQVFTVADSNGNPLNHPITFQLSAGVTPSPFVFSGSSTCPASTTSLCSASVVFSPQSAGTSLLGTLTATDSVSGSSGLAYLNGSATGVPAVTLSPSPLVFPARPVGSTSIPSVITLTATGNAPLTISSIALTGVVANNYTQTNTCQSGLAMGASCAISVTFAPTVAGTQGATLVVTTNAASSPDMVTITGSTN